MIGNGHVTVSIDLDVEPLVAFDVFTRETAAWYRVGDPANSHDPKRALAMRFEPGVGGRLLEVYSDDPEDVFVYGHIRVWEPGERLVFDWRLANFAPDQVTEVHVEFEATGSGTRVSLQHRGWNLIPEDHPAKHGLAEQAHTYSCARWWARHLESIREHVSTTRK